VTVLLYVGDREISGGNDMKKALIVLLILLLSVSLFGCGVNGGQVKNQAQPKQKQSQSNVPVNAIVYKNTQYGFDFSLPQSWKDFTIVTGKWEGLATGDGQGETIVATGSIISIRHPQWISANPRQDIPIMIFTISQWNALQQDKFHIGAAPIGPSELGRNSRYVFALPARYNFAFPTGYEEVEKILKNNPLQPNI
jgi:predicted small lipoprotein YifL